MIKGSLQTKRNKPRVLVENKISFASSDTELSIYDTFEQATRIKLESDRLMFCGMVSGKKIMHAENNQFETAFLPHESFVMAPNQEVEIDFPLAKLCSPTTCLAIEISKERITQIVNHLNHSMPLEKAFGDWHYQHELIHTHHNSQTQALLNRIVQLYTENHQDRSIMIDLAISELTTRLLRHQTRDFILHYSEAEPDKNSLNAVVSYINQHIVEPIDIDQLCRIACMSRTKFFEQFKSHLGCSPSVYQLQIRLTKAAQLIKAGKQITHTCFELGFSNASHFSRAFKSFYGLSPKQYQQRHLIQ